MTSADTLQEILKHFTRKSKLRIDCVSYIMKISSMCFQNEEKLTCYPLNIALLFVENSLLCIENPCSPLKIPCSPLKIPYSLLKILCSPLKIPCSPLKIALLSDMTINYP